MYLKELAYFDIIYCINLRNRTDRKELFFKEIDKIWLWKKIIFFEGVEKKNWHLWCLLSHRKIVQIAKKNWYKSVLVFEDDAELIEANIDQLKEAVKNLLTRKWSIFYLWCTFSFADFPYLEKSNSIYRVHGGMSTHAIAYNCEFYDHFLEITKDSEWIIDKYKAIDVYLSLFWQENYNAYMPLLPIFKQKIGFSTIENKVMNLDQFIITNFYKLAGEWKTKRLGKKILRKIIFLIWKRSDRKINLFFLIRKLCHDLPKKVCVYFGISFKTSLK